MRTLYLLAFALLFSAAARTQDSWQQKSNYPAGIRIGAISFTIGDKAYIGTGSDDVVNHDDFWQYDPATDTWTQKADFGGGIRYFGAAFAVNGKGYSGLGLVGSYDWRRDIWEYDPVANTWTQKNDFPGQFRYAPVSFAIGSKGYIGTGNYRISPAYDAEYQNDFWEYDPGTDMWTRKADVPQQGRTNACGFSIGNKGYIGTGFYYYDTRLNDLWEYDPNTNIWTRKADIPATPRFGAQALSIDDKGYVMQGWYYSALSDTWEYDPASNSWTQKTSMPGTARNSGVAFSINHRGYIGLGSDAVGALQDMWQYSPRPVAPTSVRFEPNVVSTIAGNGNNGLINGAASQAQFNNPSDVACDTNGVIYVADKLNHCIRKISNGLVTVLAGTGNPGYVNGSTGAQFNAPTGIDVDPSGVIYVADQSNNRIRRIDPDGSTINLAGNGVAGFADGYASEAQFYGPSDVVLDKHRNVYVADRGNNRIRKIISGYVITLAGNGTQGITDGPGSEASFTNLNKMVIDRDGNIYVTELDGPIRKIQPDGTVSTVQVPGMFGFKYGIATDNQGDFYVTVLMDASNNHIDVFNPVFDFSGIVGNNNGYADGIGKYAQFDYGDGITYDKFGRLLVADVNNNRIRAVSVPGYHFTAKPGQVSASSPFVVSGNSLQGNINITVSNGFEISPDSGSSFTDNLYLTPGNGNILAIKLWVRMSSQTRGGDYHGKVTISSSGATEKSFSVSGYVQQPSVVFDRNFVTTYAGTLAPGRVDGSLETAQFNAPVDIATDQAGNNYLADASNHVIRKITPAGIVSTLAGNGTPGFADGNGVAAQFYYPSGVALDIYGNVYVADAGNQRIRKISPAGEVTTIAGDGIQGFADGSAASAHFSWPSDVAVDAMGNVFVADKFNNRIRKVGIDGVVSTFVGNGTGSSVDGVGTEATLYDPDKLVFDNRGYLYVTEFYGPLRIISPSAEVTSYFSDVFTGFHTGISVDSLGNIFVSTTINSDVNYVIRRLKNGGDAVFAGSTTGFANGASDTAKFRYVAGISLQSNGDILAADPGNNMIRRLGLPQLQFSTAAGNPSPSQYFSISAIDLTDNAQVIAPSGYQLALDPGGPYQAAVSVSHSAGEINSVKLYIRMTGAGGGGVYNGNVQLSSGSLPVQYLPVSGTIIDTVPPIITALGSLTLCNKASGQYVIPAITATDISGIKTATYTITGATGRSGQGYNASGAFNPGYSTIKWTVTDSSGNVAVAQTIVRVNTAINVSIPNVMPGILFGRPNTIYIGYGLQCVYLSATVTGGVRPPAGYKFQWSTGASTSYINVCGTTPGTYTYTVTVTDSLGCQATASKVINVVDVRCGPQNNKVLVCFTIFGRTSTQCYTPAQATLALLIGAQLGPCGSTLQSEPLTTAPKKAEAADWLNGQLLISPNPNNGNFTLQWKGVLPTEVRIYDQNGKPVYGKMINGSTKNQVLSIQCGPLASGMYIVQVIGKDGMLTGKMLVQ